VVRGSTTSSARWRGTRSWPGGGRHPGNIPLTSSNATSPKLGPQRATERLVLRYHHPNEEGSKGPLFGAAADAAGTGRRDNASTAYLSELSFDVHAQVPFWGSCAGHASPSPSTTSTRAWTRYPPATRSRYCRPSQGLATRIVEEPIDVGALIQEAQRPEWGCRHVRWDDAGSIQ